MKTFDGKCYTNFANIPGHIFIYLFIALHKNNFQNLDEHPSKSREYLQNGAVVCKLFF